VIGASKKGHSSWWGQPPRRNVYAWWEYEKMEHGEDLSYLSGGIKSS